MNSNNIKLYIFILFISLLFYSCANIVMPTGGKKDTKGPVILKTTPQNKTLNFNSKTIEFQFDEYIQAKDFNTKFSILPVINKMPEYKIKKKNLIIELPNKLKDSTTYVIDFGGSIVDINEGNPVKDFKYILSTGNNIDTFMIKGNVINAFDLKPEKDVIVMLYKKCDTLPNNKLIEYFTRTNEAGYFEIKYIKPSKYNLFCLKDNNNNMLYDLPEEEIGYIDTCFNIFNDSLNHTATIKNFKIFMFLNAKTKQRLLKYDAEEYCKLKFIFNKPSDSISIKLLQTNYPLDSIVYIKEKSRFNDTIIYWLKETDSLSLLFQVKDGNEYTDTVRIKLKTKTQILKELKDKFNLILKTNINNSSSFPLNKPIQISFSHPLKNYDFSKILITSNKKIIYPDSIVLDENHKNIYIYNKWAEKTQYNLHCDKNIFSDIFNLQNDSFSINFKTKELKDYSTILLKIQAPISGTNIIIQLLDEQNNTLQEKYIEADSIMNIKFDYIEPRKYKFRLILDTNNNKIWDTGNIFKSIQPEKIVNFPEIINVRANWDYDYDWKVIMP